MGHESVSPVRWTNANTLILERHDYYEKLTPSSETFTPLVISTKLRCLSRTTGRPIHRGSFAMTSNEISIAAKEHDDSCKRERAG